MNFHTYKLNSSICAWKSLVFQLFWRSHGERSTAKNYHPVSLLAVVIKVFEKIVNNRIVDQLEKCGLFSDSQYGFRSFWPTADLLTVVPVRIVRTPWTPYLVVAFSLAWSEFELKRNAEINNDFGNGNCWYLI